MTLPTHILAGLIIGKITGDFRVAVVGSVIMDVDHLFSYYSHGVLFKPRQLIKALSAEADPWGDQRGILHNVFVWLGISIILTLISFKVGIVFSIAYLAHLAFDALDTSDYHPFFPNKKIKLIGPIKFYSKQEALFDVLLILILAILFLK